MRISIGIVAWNEAGSIAMTIGSIFSQRLFRQHQEGVEGIEVAVLANGCTDGTADVARVAFEKHLAACPLKYVTARVWELPEPDRPGTWNEFVHRLSDRDSDYIVMMDGDVCLDGRDTIWNLVRALERDPYACASASRGIKDVALMKRKSLFDRICLAMTDMIGRAASPRPYLTGGCYCGRAALWRRVELPKGMRGDDSFLSRMVTTSLLTTKPDYKRIARPPEATFVFEAYDDPWVLFRQHCRRMVGRFIESLIYDDVGREVTKTGADAGEVLRRRNRENPEWLVELIRKRVGDAELFAIPPRRIFLRLTQLPYQPFQRRLLMLPLAVLGTIWDLLVLIAATRTMKRDHMEGVWFDTRNKRLVNDRRLGPEGEDIHSKQAACSYR